MIHFLINIGMVVGILPVIGIPLPFVSYGGSSLLVNIFMLGIIANIYRNRKTILNNMMTAVDKIINKNDAGKFICVGLDTDKNKIPDFLKNDPDGVFKFNQSIIEATKDYSAAYKINFAFYEQAGSDGIKELERTVD